MARTDTHPNRYRAITLAGVGVMALLAFLHATDIGAPDRSEIPVMKDAEAAQDVGAGHVRTASFSGADDSATDGEAEVVPILSVRPIAPVHLGSGDLRSAALPPYALIIPVEGVGPDDLFDSFGDARGAERRHLAIDIMAPTGTPVLAAASGEIVRMHNSPRGGITLYLVDEAGQYIYYYAHLDGYADGIREGLSVGPGDLIGYVGHTGNADAGVPHLHFAIWKKRPGRSFWGGSPVNPYLALTR